MSQSFGASALELYAIAARLLGWRPGEFWQATPAELAVALKTPGTARQGLGREDLIKLMERDNG
jgi:hypothetical protein